jgi:hypothetical protein
MGDQHLVTRIELGECVLAIRGGLVMGSIGELSLAQCFVWRSKPILFAELIGFVPEHQESLDLLYVRRANCLQVDGGLCEKLFASGFHA